MCARVGYPKLKKNLVNTQEILRSGVAAIGKYMHTQLGHQMLTTLIANYGRLWQLNGKIYLRNLLLARRYCSSEGLQPFV